MRFALVHAIRDGFNIFPGSYSPVENDISYMTDHNGKKLLVDIPASVIFI